ncbi:MAG: tRNA (adenosine(37)-N6)-dimethylallyltransferase MiaA [Rhodobacteraceae bacterium]|nr:tRNA (adenosine(37)-N6)-dimethylallyltransferase MiaA [Paracoccaceae bacterium]
MNLLDSLPEIPANRPILIAGPTASGKSALAMEIARRHGGVIVNADASQVFDCWRVITARPSVSEEMQVAHHLYGHVGWDTPYSAGHWLREVTPLLQSKLPGERVIIVGGTGLYFMALTKGLADIPEIPQDVRTLGDAMSAQAMARELDMRTADKIDMQNRARLQRAWEVLKATGRGLAEWQANTPPPVLPFKQAAALVVEADKDWLEARINRRFDDMLDQGALAEVEAMLEHYDPGLPAFRAIGVPELVAHLRGEMTLDQARAQVRINTRRFAKRQRTWFRSKMSAWHKMVLTA